MAKIARKPVKNAEDEQVKGLGKHHRTPDLNTPKPK